MKPRRLLPKPSSLLEEVGSANRLGFVLQAVIPHQLSPDAVIRVFPVKMRGRKKQGYSDSLRLLETTPMQADLHERSYPYFPVSSLILNSTILLIRSYGIGLSSGNFMEPFPDS